jgi:glycosyltransferase involved in cell wall biosynthesis
LRVNFISNLDLSETTGGWSGVNVAIHAQLAEHFDLRFAGPINPSNDYPAKLISKVQRLNGRAGAFHFFSERRLNRIAKLVENAIDEDADCDFFHGQTPWILYESQRPYFLYTDTCFSTYIDVYHDRSKFRPDDLKRICETEGRWLSRAARVFFGTRWGLERAATDYRIPRSNLSAVGAGGSMSPPPKDTYDTGMSFLFIALDFERKGGRICAEAFNTVYARFPEARLTFVGAAPPADLLALPGVSYIGLLRKSVPAELARLESIYSEAFALVHPTSSDIQPLVISEAGYYGCPSIAARSFGIPELVEDGVTGFLIDPPLTAEAFANRMLELCADRNRYFSMRKTVRVHATKNLTWQAVGARIVDEMKATLRRQ